MSVTTVPHKHSGEGHYIGGSGGIADSTMEKYEQVRPDAETIESWLDGFEARLLCHNIQTCQKKRNWCQALVGEAGRSIIQKLLHTATWDEVKRELCDVLGETDPKDWAIEGLLKYKPKDIGLGGIAADIIAKAARAPRM